ncbi:MAG TPA: ribosome maturation factor RimM [Paenibacillus sp.]|uniref:ribosome maturation factor RimM n=1 Tax=Paenibacillus sp. TaxID=58172 RepID=UPI0028D9045F|nr:ribosome maturation factor RimM [Paenibacillus sp.]HUC91000.1 ribosome maturation factor RimM [Paenibacillus sp.]
MSDKWFTVGKLVNTHGIRGDVKMLPLTDFPDVRFASGSKLTLHDPQSSATATVEVVSAREQKGMYVVKLKGYDNINEVERFKGWDVKVKETELAPLEEGEYYYHEIVGCRVMTEEGEELGAISEVLAPGANHVWVVDRPKGKQVLLPVIDDVVLGVNVKDKLVTVRLMEGLI